MKRYILILCCFCMSLALYAQTMNIIVEDSDSCEKYSLSDIANITFDNSSMILLMNDQSQIVFALEDIHVITYTDGEYSAINNVLSTINSLSYSMYPNPTHDKIVISYYLPTDCNLSLRIYDVSGNLIQTLYAGYQSSGEQIGQYNIGHLSSGNYICTLVSQNVVYSKMLIKL